VVVLIYLMLVRLEEELGLLRTVSLLLLKEDGAAMVDVSHSERRLRRIFIVIVLY